MFEFPKEQILSNENEIEKLFLTNNSFEEAPFRVLWMVEESINETTLKSLIVVPKKRLSLAVNRNKVKRRIRHLIKDFLPKYGKNGYDYVFIAKENLINEDWDKLKLESISVLKDLKYE